MTLSPVWRLAVLLTVALGCLAPLPLPSSAEWTADLLGVTPQGESIRLSQYRGKLVLLSFWTTWCPPCRAELPRVEQFHRAFRDNGLVVVAVNAGEKPKVVRKFLRLNRVLTLPVVLDVHQITTERYGVDGYPTSVILDWNGAVRWSKSGFDASFQEELLRELNKLVAEYEARGAEDALPPVGD